MTPQQLEAAEAAATFHVAMAMLGADAFGESVDLWQDVVPTSTRVTATSAAYLVIMLRSLRRRRHQVQALAVAYYRLARALHTGTTIQPLLGDEPEALTLNKLRQDFVKAVQHYAPEALKSAHVDDPTPGDGINDASEIETPDGSPYRPYSASGRTDSPVTVEDVDGLEGDLDQLESDAEAEANAILEALGQDLLTERLRKLDLEQLTAQEADRRQEEEHGKVGRRTAAHVERMVQNGGRHAEEMIARRDPKVLGFVRVHYPRGDFEPCSFCAMLISRGVVYKKKSSERRSTRDNATWQMWRKGFDVPGAEFDKFHVLCHCRGEAVYSESQYEDDDRFQANRELGKLWQDEIAEKGYRGKEAEAQWRIIINARNEKSRQARGGTEHSHE